MNRFRVLLLTLFTISTVACGTSPEAESTAENEGADQLYTCGMQTQVIQHEKGTCPICGMNLTPMANTDEASTTPDGEKKIAYWQAPMDPTYIRDTPGKSPMGMDLIPVYEGDVQTSNIVKIQPGIIQQMGVETAPVTRTTVFRHVRTIGEVEVGEDQLEVVNLRFSGWVERLYVKNTGDEVHRGQTLFDIYSPELVAAQEEYLLAIRSQGVDSPLAKSSRRRLELWNLSSRDIDGIAKSGKSRRAMPIRSPISGFVLHKSPVEGARIRAGEDVFRIGNLTKIWITAEIYEHDAPWIELDQPAQAEITNMPGEVLEGKVAYIYPTLNKTSRTLTVRLEFDNPGVRLKPGMFATVYVQYRKKENVVAVPTEAILYSGRRSIAFVALGRGRFEPREVTPGLVGDHRLVEILDGLHEGDVVVTSGQFLIDSESQLQEALAKILAGARGANEEKKQTASTTTVWSCPMHPEELSDGEGRCSQCGMFLEERPGTDEELEAVHGIRKAKPGQYSCPMHPEVISDEPGRCPECGMFLEQVPDPEGMAEGMPEGMPEGHDHKGHDAQDHEEKP